MCVQFVESALHMNEAHLIWWLLYVGHHNSVENLSYVSNQMECVLAWLDSFTTAGADNSNVLDGQPTSQLSRQI